MDKDGEPAERGSRYLIASLARGLAVLDSFSPTRPELSLADIGEAAGVTSASAVRIGYTLIAAGYMVRNPRTKGFRPGPNMIGAGLATLASLTLPELAEPFLIELRDRSEETVNLAVPAEREVIVVYRAPSRAFPPGPRFPGASLPYHTSSLGLAILASLPEDVAEEILSHAEEAARLTPRSRTAAEARKELASIRRRGYALNDQGTTVEHRSVAAPILATDGTPVAAINLSVSVQRIPRRELERRLAPMVVETAAAIGATIPPDLQRPGWADFS